MSAKKALPDPTQNFKLTKRAQGTLEKEDLSDIVKTKKVKPALYAFPLRLTTKEKTFLENMTEEINSLSSFKSVSKNDMIRALIIMGSELSKEKIITALRNLF